MNENNDKTQLAAGWMKILKDCCEAGGIKVTDNEEFRTIEKFYFLGITVGIEAAGGDEKNLVPRDVRALKVRPCSLSPNRRGSGSGNPK